MSNKQTTDGNGAAAYVSYAFTEVAGIYPITPSSPIAEHIDEWASKNKKNLFDQTVQVVEMQSEAGAAGFVHGSSQAGCLTTTYTASQGLLLMIPNMYKIAGELLPCVFHVTARTIATHALSIFGDHSDVMACRQTGFAMLCSNSPQEVMDLSAVAHLCAIKSRVPFLHFFDGFRTSHEIQKIDCLDYQDLNKLIDYDAVRKFKARALNPEHPVTRGTAQNSDVFFQSREASNVFYNALPQIVESYMEEINKLTGRDYKLFNYYGAKDAERIIISMGSSCEAIEETIDYLNAHNEKVGLIKVRLYRPFAVNYFLEQIPASVKKIAVLDRTKESGSVGEPLYLDVVSALYQMKRKDVQVFGGRYGLASKDFTPAHVISIYKNLSDDNPKNNFTVGINDDVTNLSLNVENTEEVFSSSTNCKFWGLGSDGTVSANKNTIKIIGNHTDWYVQAYFEYDSKKSFGVTRSHLRFGKDKIRSTYFVTYADFVACHNFSFVHKYDMLRDLKIGGTFLLNSPYETLEELKENLPARMKKQLLEKKIKFYIIDGVKLAQEIGLGNRINTILQAAFFKLVNIIPVEQAETYMKEAIKKTYGKKGDKVVNMNYAAVDAGLRFVKQIDVSALLKNSSDDSNDSTNVIDDNLNEGTEKFIRIAKQINDLNGDDLPVSAFKDFDGSLVPGTSAYEKRGIAVQVPEWIKENCIQCAQCSLVCPHATVRPFLLSQEEVNNAPKSFETKDAAGKELKDYKFRVQVDILDCTGCGNCAHVCPAKQKALVMKPTDTQINQIENWNYAVNKLSYKDTPIATNIRNSQLKQPLLEFSGACAGCGETPYAKLLTQLFGNRMYIANATGCSSIWGGSYPASPYCYDHNHRGPAWANSLFEDNAEFGFGMYTAVKQMRERLKEKLMKIFEVTHNNAIKMWLDNFNNGIESILISEDLVVALQNILSQDNIDEQSKSIIKDVILNKDWLVKKSQWILGGDGWAYDIGFGGLDHVLASGEDVNVLVFDTEVYSNTGGQSSKATPTAAVAKFAASGKKTRKKDLGMIAMTYGYVYVAQVAMGANQNQLIKALLEAEKYNGPSLIIAYAPCINHGIKTGMTCSQEEMKKAVDCGYWHLYRYNPDLLKENKNPFMLDSKEPTKSFQDFLNNEVRYSSLKLFFPDKADELFKKAEADAKFRYQSYKKLSE
jgi:pyruvate-ferredoxin/flavodoxin oxidoreductase